MLADIITGANTGPTGVNQLREDATLQANTTGSTAAPLAGINAYAEDSIIRFRDANVWIEDKTLGRLTVGHLTNPGPQGFIDLGGTAVAAPAAYSLMGGAFSLPQEFGWGLHGRVNLEQHRQRGRLLTSYGLDPVGLADSCWVCAERGVW